MLWTIFIISPIVLLLMEFLFRYSNFNRLRLSYLRQFEYYLKNGIVNEAYCNNFIEYFAKPRFKMFWNYLLGARKLEQLIDNPQLCSNFRASLMIKRNRKNKYIEDANEIIEHWYNELRNKP